MDQEAGQGAGKGACTALTEGKPLSGDLKRVAQASVADRGCDIIRLPQETSGCSKDEDEDADHGQADPQPFEKGGERLHH
jgi:hypothetical protein